MKEDLPLTLEKNQRIKTLPRKTIKQQYNLS